MFKQKEWIFVGKSGEKYAFDICKKASQFPSNAGVFILAYTHPRGHLAGFETHALHIGCSDNLNESLLSPPQQDCVTKECWNCTYILLTEDQKTQTDILSDLRASLPTPC